MADDPDHGALVPVSRAAQLVARFTSRRKPRTRQTYEECLRDFARYLVRAYALPKPDPELAVAALLSRPSAAEANGLVLDYVTDLRTRDRGGGKVGYAPNTVNVRLTTLRSLVKLARTTGIVTWTLEIEGDVAEAYVDTRGPGREAFVAMLQVVGQDLDERRKTRNVALLRLGYDMALRRGEVVSLDLEHLDLQAGTLSVLGKRRNSRLSLTVPTHARIALARWVGQRGHEPGPLFLSFDRARKGDGRLTARGLDTVVKRIGGELGLHVKFHGLRHSAITDALDATKGDIRAVQRFSRHKDPRVLLNDYDDNRRDLGGEVAELVSSRAQEPDEQPDD